MKRTTIHEAKTHLSRLIADVEQGAEVLVATEHKRIHDYQPVVEAMGLAKLVVALTGTELTGMARGDRIARTIGHDNVFPLQARSPVGRFSLLCLRLFCQHRAFRAMRGLAIWCRFTINLAIASGRDYLIRGLKCHYASSFTRVNPSAKNTSR